MQPTEAGATVGEGEQRASLRKLLDLVNLPRATSAASGQESGEDRHPSERSERPSRRKNRRQPQRTKTRSELSGLSEK